MKADNRVIWAEILEDDYRGQADLLRPLVRFYVSIAEGSCDLERDLGKCLVMLEQHGGGLDPTGNTTWNLLEVAVDGPATEGDLFHKPAHPSTQLLGGQGTREPLTVQDSKCLLMTPFSRKCQELWIGVFGRRFGVNQRERKDKGKTKPKNPGTLKAVVDRRRQAVSALYNRAKSGAGGSDETLLGVPRSTFVRRAHRSLSASKCWNATLDRFHKLSIKKQARAGRDRAATALRCGGLIIPKEIPDESRHAGLVRVTVWPATLAAEVIGQLDRCQVVNATTCTVVLTKNMALLDVPDHDSLWIAVLVVGLGKSIALLSNWDAMRPARSPVVQHMPAAQMKAEQIHIPDVFARRHHRVFKAIQECVSWPGSKWTLVESDRATTTLESCEQVSAVVQRHRRILSRGICGGTFVD